MNTKRSTRESEDAGVPPAAYEMPLKELLGDASVLLWFATREGKEVDDSVLKAIVTAQGTLREGVRDPKIEGNFWTGYRKLAKAVQPASIDSILATYGYPFGYHHGVSRKRRLTDAVKTKKYYSRLSLCMLLLLIFVQIFWFIGTTWRTDLETDRMELDRIAGTLREMMIEVKATHDLKNHLVTLKGQQPTNGEQVSMPYLASLIGDGNPGSAIDKGIQALIERQDRKALLYANATLRGDRVEKMLQANNKMLIYWDFVTDLVDWFAGEAGGASGESAASEAATGTGGGYLSGGRYLSGGSNGAATTRGKWDSGATTTMCLDDNVNKFYRTLCEKASALEEQQRGVEDALVNSKSILAIISQYLLPLLYGIVGSLAYILRTLSSEI